MIYYLEQCSAQHNPSQSVGIVSGSYPRTTGNNSDNLKESLEAIKSGNPGILECYMMRLCRIRRKSVNIYLGYSELKHDFFH